MYIFLSETSDLGGTPLRACRGTVVSLMICAPLLQATHVISKNMSNMSNPHGHENDGSSKNVVQ